MRTRALGSTGLSVSEIGFGAWQLGQRDKMSEAEALKLVERALDRGCNFFDTAPNYGESESVLGRALAGAKERAVVCTKFGHASNGGKDFDLDQLAPSLEASLRRLQRDAVDLLLLHNPPRELLDGAHPIYERLERLREQGKLRFFGVSVDFAAEIEAALESGAGQVFEVLFNVFHQEPRRAFAAAERQGVGLIVKVPLDSGWLSGRFDSKSRFSDIRSRWTPEVLARRAAFLDKVRFIASPEVPLAQAALRFCLGHSAVSTVIPGSGTIEQLELNLAASAGPLPDETLARLHALWDYEFSRESLPW
jgi:aryl-alcohol dehydrogenase-like predicted oxidoreductase